MFRKSAAKNVHVLGRGRRPGSRWFPTLDRSLPRRVTISLNVWRVSACGSAGIDAPFHAIFFPTYMRLSVSPSQSLRLCLRLQMRSGAHSVVGCSLHAARSPPSAGCRQADRGPVSARRAAFHQVESSQTGKRLGSDRTICGAEILTGASSAKRCFSRLLPRWDEAVVPVSLFGSYDASLCPQHFAQNIFTR